MSRSIGSIAKIQALGKPEGGGEEEDDLLSSLTKRRGGRTKKGIQKISPRDWLLTEEGLKFRHPTIGRTNWLGDDIPFPTNPWFKPQPPTSDKLRTRVYESFKKRVNLMAQKSSYQRLDADEKKKQEQILIRQTSEQWGICRDRIGAIIRLKAMEDSWSIDHSDEPGQSIQRRTLQLNFEKGMEAVLGVQSDQATRVNEDIEALDNRRLQRKLSFYGTQFVPLDAPVDEPLTGLPPSTSEVNPAPNQRRTSPSKYREDDEPTATRHLVGSDGLPRPPPSYISKPPSKVPMVFTDVSKFPRAPKPMSKRKARYYPKTSLLPDYSILSANSVSKLSSRSRRSHSSFASAQVFDEPRVQPRYSSTANHASVRTLEDDQKAMEDQRRALTSKLLRQLKGCATSENGLKVLEQLAASTDSSEFSELAGVDPDEIKEALLLRAGGLSFKTPGKANHHNALDHHHPKPNEESSLSLSEHEKKIRSIKFEMIKSIYLKKLELNSAGRLLLPKSIRSKQEHDIRILQNCSTIKRADDQNSRRDVQTAFNVSDGTSSRSNRLIRQCMKGPLGRMKQRRQLQLMTDEYQLSD